MTTSAANFIADPNFGSYDGSADSTANSQGWVVVAGSTSRFTQRRTISGPWTLGVSSAAGLAGEVCFDTNFVYFCTGTNTWRRIGYAVL